MAFYFSKQIVTNEHHTAHLLSELSSVVTHFRVWKYIVKKIKHTKCLETKVRSQAEGP